MPISTRTATVMVGWSQREVCGTTPPALGEQRQRREEALGCREGRQGGGAAAGYTVDSVKNKCKSNKCGPGLKMSRSLHLSFPVSNLSILLYAWKSVAVYNFVQRKVVLIALVISVVVPVAS